MVVSAKGRRVDDEHIENGQSMTKGRKINYVVGICVYPNGQVFSQYTHVFHAI